MITHILNFISRFKLILYCLLFHTERFACGSCAEYLYDDKIICDVGRTERISMVIILTSIISIVVKIII
jgi:hypothetical protein